MGRCTQRKEHSFSARRQDRTNGAQTLLGGQKKKKRLRHETSFVTNVTRVAGRKYQIRRRKSDGNKSNQELKATWASGKKKKKVGCETKTIGTKKKIPASPFFGQASDEGIKTATAGIAKVTIKKQALAGSTRHATKTPSTPSLKRCA